MVDRMESKGRWKLELPAEKLRGEAWLKAIEGRTNYLKQARSIPLEQL
jgi:hypothetical protein